MEQKMMDYLFDLQGYLVLENTISVEDLSEMNQWIDDHWRWVEILLKGPFGVCHDHHLGKTFPSVPYTIYQEFFPPSPSSEI